MALAAPGAGLISTYPGGLYAAGWGTSFATPLVAGSVALLMPKPEGSPTSQQQALVNALRAGAFELAGLESQIGSGRLDVLGAVLASGH